MAPRTRISGSSHTLWISYWGTLKAGVSPKPALLTRAASTEASKIIATVRPEEFLASVSEFTGSRWRTLSTAKKTPAMGALKPAATPVP